MWKTITEIFIANWSCHAQVLCPDVQHLYSSPTDKYIQKIIINLYFQDV